jgi:hypothetical protein
LEVVYDIRSFPDLLQTPGNLFAVFHFHITPMTTSGFPEISYFHVFHGQRVHQPNLEIAEWRGPRLQSSPGAGQPSRSYSRL